MATIHPINALFKNHMNTEFNEQFIETLEALLFLDSPTKETFNTLFDFALPRELVHHEHSTSAFAKELQKSFDANWDDPDHSIHTLSDLLKHKFNQQHDNDGYFQKHTDVVSNKKQKENESYNIADVMIHKLVENFKRLYAADKAKNRQKTHSWGQKAPFENNQSSLLNQQDNIYKVYSMIDSLIEFDNKPKWYLKAVLGRHAHLQPVEMFTYLGLHDFLKPEHLEQHYRLLEKQIIQKNTKFSAEFIKQLSTLIHKPEKNKILHLVFEYGNNKDIVQSLEHSTKHSWLAVSIEFLFNDKNIHSVSREQKKMIFNKIFGSGLLNSPYLTQFVEDKHEFIEKLHNVFSDIGLEKDVKHLLHHISINDIGNGGQTDFILRHITSLNDPVYLMSVIRQEVDESKKQKIYSFYDFTDLNMLKDVATKVHQSTTPAQRPQAMTSFLSVHTNVICKEVLAHVLSLDSKYMSVCKPAYLKLKFKSTLGEHEKEVSTHAKKMKV